MSITRIITLRQEHSGLLGVPQSPALSPQFLPHLPLSLVHWMHALALQFWQEHHRQLALILLLDWHSRRWMATVPTQSCSATHCSFQLLEQDYQELPPHLLVVGSFQSRSPLDLLQAQQAVPPWDGVHLLSQIPSRSETRSYVFVSRQQQIQLIDPATLISDDLAQMLTRFRHRLLLL